MRDQDERRRRQGRHVRLRAIGTAVIAVGALASCTGENLFTGPSLGGGLTGPTVEITTPAADATVAAGDSVQVSASVTSSNGVSQVTFSGFFTTGTTAYIAQIVSLPNPADTTLSKFLQPAGTGTGEAKIIVEATDILGGSSADTVTVTIGS